MLTLLAPNETGSYATLASNLGVGTNDSIVISVVPQIEHTHQSAIGVCFSGSLSTMFIVAEVEDGNTFHQMPSDFVSDVLFCALEGNPLELTAGSTFMLSIAPNDDTEGVFAHVFNSELQPLALSVVPEKQQTVVATTALAGQPPAKKARNSLKSVVLPDGYVLNRENSMKAVIAWLGKHNKIHAPKHGVPKLVWCEEGSSSRSSGTVRTFFKVDLNDGNKRKICANASSAIECMEAFTGTDFYEDIKKHGHDFL